jgi:hypothetical protein
MDVSLNTAYWIGLAVSFVLPVLLALAAVNGFLVELSEAGDGYSIGTAAVLWLVSFVIGVATHFGLYKPAGISAALANVGRKV